ncbi:MAG TPA: hypothetical protein VEW91_00500, partial [bacterium]|nr:hypothetical protein [bacterium]
GMGSTGGMDSGVHLHIVLDGATLMPSKDQLTAGKPHQYKYTLPTLKAGPHTMKVYWADNKTHDARGPIHAAAFTCSE